MAIHASLVPPTVGQRNTAGGLLTEWCKGNTTAVLLSQEPFAASLNTSAEAWAYWLRVPSFCCYSEYGCGGPLGLGRLLPLGGEDLSEEDTDGCFAKKMVRVRTRGEVL